MGCYGGRWGQITKIVGLGWTGLVSHFPPFSPIVPHFFPRELSPMHPTPLALSPIKTMFFFAFSAPKFLIFLPSIQNFPQFSPFSPVFPKSAHFGDKCTVT